MCANRRAMENMINLRDGGEVVMVPNGFGVLGPADPGTNTPFPFRDLYFCTPVRVLMLSLRA